MATTAQSIIDRARIVLVDPSGIRWSTSELVLWLNDAQRQITLLKPDASAVTSVVALVPGTKQSMPAGATRLLRVVRNMSALDGVGGKPIRIVDRESLDAQVSDWHNPQATGFAAHGTVVKNYIYDMQEKSTFYVFPGIAVEGFVEMVYANTPATISESDNISLPDLYSPAILDYMLYRAYSKENEAAADSNSSAHYQLFLESIGANGNADTATNPNNQRTGSSYGARMNG